MVLPKDVDGENVDLRLDPGIYNAGGILISICNNDMYNISVVLLLKCAYYFYSCKEKIQETGLLHLVRM